MTSWFLGIRAASSLCGCDLATACGPAPLAEGVLGGGGPCSFLVSPQTQTAALTHTSRRK